MPILYQLPVLKTDWEVWDGTVGVGTSCAQPVRRIEKKKKHKK